MKKATSFSTKPRTLKLAVMFTGVMLSGTSAYADNYSSNARNDAGLGNRTVADCVHGSTGTAAALDCTRGRVNRYTNDTNAYNTDTGELNGAHLRRTNSPTVDPQDGMTARSAERY